MNEERALADRISGYGDAVAAFSLVNAYGFMAMVAEAEARCFLAENRGIVITTLVCLQILYGSAVVGLRKLEVGLREGLESSERATRFRSNFYRGRLIFVAIVTVAISITSWLVLDSGSCPVT